MIGLCHFWLFSVSLSAVLRRAKPVVSEHCGKEAFLLVVEFGKAQSHDAVAVQHQWLGPVSHTCCWARYTPHPYNTLAGGVPGSEGERAQERVLQQDPGSETGEQGSGVETVQRLSGVLKLCGR